MTRFDKSMMLLVAGGAGLWLLSRLARRPDYSFSDKVVFITGGSRGLGLVMARQLTQDGARVAICGRDSAELQRAAADLTSHGAVPFTMVADVADSGQMREAVCAIERNVGPIEVVINNAGIICVGPLESMTRRDFEEALSISFWGAYNTIEAVLPGMRERQQGRIVNIASIGGKVSVPHLLPYCVGKFALVGYSEGLRPELARHGITVTTVSPGLMRTGSPRQARFKGNHEAEYSWFKVSGSLPLLTVSAEQAASEILDASRRGDAQCIVSMPARVGILMNTLFPELTANLVYLANQVLPAAQGETPSRAGKDIDIAAVLSSLTALTDAAAARNNEHAPEEVAATAALES